MLAPELVGLHSFINTETISLSSLLRRRVVLLFFWNGTAPSSLRTLRTVNALYEKYRGSGLEVIGVHTPEFSFEDERAHVERIVREHHVLFPVALDNDYETWSAYDNEYWPQLYLVNIEGEISHTQVGERGWKMFEEKLRNLLQERAVLSGDTELGFLAHWAPIAEKRALSLFHLYFGLRQKSDSQRGSYSFEGAWKNRMDHAESMAVGSVCLFEVPQGNVYLLADGPRGARIKVSVEGVHPASSSGKSVDGGGYVTLSSPRLLSLLHNVEPGRQIGLECSSPGIKLYRVVVE